MKKTIPFTYKKITTENAWLLGFIFADGGLYKQAGKEIIRLHNINKPLLENICTKYKLPYKVTKQVTTTTTVYFIRFSDQVFIDSIKELGFMKDRTNLSIPKMNKMCTTLFLKGFLKGKGSFFKEKDSNNHGFKVIYRSQKFINELGLLISKTCNVKVSKIYSKHSTTNLSYEIKYVGKEADKIKCFLLKGFEITGNSKSQFIEEK